MVGLISPCAVIPIGVSKKNQRTRKEIELFIDQRVHQREEEYLRSRGLLINSEDVEHVYWEEEFKERVGKDYKEFLDEGSSRVV